jgi:hypothetical protein
MHRKNLIIPLVGNFAGPKTIRRISEYLKQRNQTVAAFYLSNVEYYLEGQTTKDFHANVATLPIDSSSMLIRWVPRPGIPFVASGSTDDFQTYDYPPYEHESPQLEAGGFRVKQQGAA